LKQEWKKGRKSWPKWYTNSKKFRNKVKR